MQEAARRLRRAQVHTNERFIGLDQVARGIDDGLTPGVFRRNEPSAAHLAPLCQPGGSYGTRARQGKSFTCPLTN